MNEKQERIFNIIGISIVAAVCIFLIIKNIVENYKLEKDFRFTIAIIGEISSAAEGDADAKIVYHVNKKTFKGSCVIGIYPYVKPKQRYYIKFYPRDPRIVDVLFDMPVPDSIKEAPDGGWEVLP